jgi:hypothetical protein
MGLQRDCSGYGFAPEEVQRRRVVFWELFVFETWTVSDWYQLWQGCWVVADFGLDSTEFA